MIGQRWDLCRNGSDESKRKDVPLFEVQMIELTFSSWTCLEIGGETFFRCMVFLQRMKMTMNDETSASTYRRTDFPIEITDDHEFLIFLIGIDSDRSPVM